VTLHDPAQGQLLGFDVKPNMKTLGPKFGPRLKVVQAAIAAADPATLAEQAQAGKPVEVACPNGAVVLDPGDLVVTLKAPEGWAGVADRGTQVLVDTRITDALKQEGIARDVVRQVQELRKQSGLEMEDRIVLYLGTEPEQLRRAIETHKEYICNETLAVELSSQPLAGEGVYSATVRIDGSALTIQLRKAIL
jgi:isoleucyl-tRNA synthetase